MLNTIWPYLATALGTLAVAAIVQLSITPRVETRKRREARWEADVLTLGEFLEFDLPDAQAAWMSAIYGAAAIGAVVDPDPHRLAELERDNRLELRTTGEALRRSYSRMEWLLRRTLVLEGFSTIATTLRMRAMIAGSTVNSGVWSANDRDAPALDGDESLALRRKLDKELEPLKEYARNALERSAPRPQSRFGFKVRRIRRLAWKKVRRVFARRRSAST